MTKTATKTHRGTEQRKIMEARRKERSNGRQTPQGRAGAAKRNGNTPSTGPAKSPRQQAPRGKIGHPRSRGSTGVPEFDQRVRAHLTTLASACQPKLKINKTWAKMLKPLSPTEHELLKESIKASGILTPIIVDEKGQVIDGHHRAKIAQELGIECPRTVREGLTEDQKLEQVILLNAARRQMTGDDITVAAQALKTKGWSNRRIAKLLGVSEPTARRKSAGAKPKGGNVTGADGVKQPATKAKASKNGSEPKATASKDLNADAGKLLGFLAGITNAPGGEPGDRLHTLKPAQRKAALQIVDRFEEAAREHLTSSPKTCVACR